MRADDAAVGARPGETLKCAAERAAAHACCSLHVEERLSPTFPNPQQPLSSCLSSPLLFSSTPSLSSHRHSLSFPLYIARALRSGLCGTSDGNETLSSMVSRKVIHILKVEEA